MNKESKEDQPYFAHCFTWRKKWKLAKNTGQCLPGLTSLCARNQRAWFHLFCYIERGKNLTIKCHKDLYHVTVLTYIIKTCLTMPRKIKQEEEMLTKR